MKCCFEKRVQRTGSQGKARDGLRVLRRGRGARGAFSLVEVLGALAILALAGSSVLVVINRCMVSVANTKLRMQAFEVARENMEMLLSMDAVEEMVDYGESEEYPEITWDLTVERFNLTANLGGVVPDLLTDPMNNLLMDQSMFPASPNDVNEPPPGSQSWVRAVSVAEYTDPEGEVQTVELIQWLTKLSEQQAQQMARQDELLAEHYPDGIPPELMIFRRQDQVAGSRPERPGQRPGQRPEQRPSGDRPTPPPGDRMSEQEFMDYINNIMKQFGQ